MTHSPAAVHSVNLTSATSFGFTQVVASSLTRRLNGDQACAAAGGCHKYWP
jgi:hypothetical protein